MTLIFWITALWGRESRRKDKRNTSQVIQKRSLISLLQMLKCHHQFQVFVTTDIKCPHNPCYTAQCQDSLLLIVTRKDGDVSRKLFTYSRSKTLKSWKIFCSICKKYIQKSTVRWDLKNPKKPQKTHIILENFRVHSLQQVNLNSIACP